jgi:hypothetical protein
MAQNIKPLNDIDIQIFEILVNWIKENKSDQTPMPYAQLTKKIDNPSVIPVNVGIYLGNISTYCMEHNAPPISAVVGGSDTVEPGKGFFDLIGYPELKADKRIDVWLPKLKEVYDYDGWDEVIEKAKS